MREKVSFFPSQRQVFSVDMEFFLHQLLDCAFDFLFFCIVVNVDDVLPAFSVGKKCVALQVDLDLFEAEWTHEDFEDYSGLHHCSGTDGLHRVLDCQGVCGRHTSVTFPRILEASCSMKIWSIGCGASTMVLTA